MNFCVDNPNQYGRETEHQPRKALFERRSRFKQHHKQTEANEESKGVINADPSYPIIKLPAIAKIPEHI